MKADAKQKKEMKKEKVGSEKSKEEERRKRKKDKMEETPKSSSKKSESRPSTSKSPEREVNPSLQKIEKKFVKAQNDDSKGKSRSKDEVTASAEKSTPSTRRVKIMRVLGLMAPAGSPFYRRECVSTPPKSPYVPKKRASAPSKSPIKNKERVPATNRMVVCGLSAAKSADHVTK